MTGHNHQEALSVAGPEFALRNLSCPSEVMRFHLVYSGPLPASASSSKPDFVKSIRDQLHPQLKMLWETHTALKRLRSTAVVALEPGKYLGTPQSPFGVERDPKYPIQDGFVDLCLPIEMGGKKYSPLVTGALDLNCSLSILFLRQEDPGALILKGGDLDNRIKTLCDALRMPDADVEARYPQAQDHTYCLLESDTLISGLEVETGRLLFPKTDFPNEVHLVIEVSVKVLKVGPWNVCLLGN